MRTGMPNRTKLSAKEEATFGSYKQARIEAFEQAKKDRNARVFAKHQTDSDKFLIKLDDIIIKTLEAAQKVPDGPNAENTLDAIFKEGDKAWKRFAADMRKISKISKPD